MRIFERLSLMVRADAHGVMDQLEERSLLLKQHLRDAEIEVEHKRGKLATLQEEERLSRQRIEGLDDEITCIDEDIELALAGGKEELARFAVRRLLPKRDARTRLRQRLAHLGEERGRLSKVLEEQEKELDALRGQVRARLASMEEQRRERSEGSMLDCREAVAEEEVELELLRRQATASAAGEGA